MNFSRSTDYRVWPTTPIKVVAGSTGRSYEGSASIDTGSDATLLDYSVAESLGLDLSGSARVTLRGLGGRLSAAGSATVEIQILGDTSLSARVQAGFVPDLLETFGNIIGLDVLQSIDVGLSHRDRVLYFGLPR